jgi:hypothetical protein
MKRLKAAGFTLLFSLMLVLSLLPTEPVFAFAYTPWTAKAPLKSERRLIHDLNYAQSDNYYVALYVDASNNLMLQYAASSLLTGGSQQIVAAANWVPSDQYALSENIQGETFYVAYERSTSQIIVQNVTIAYVNGVFSSFTLGQTGILTLTYPISAGGISLMMASDGSNWLSVTELGTVQIIQVFQFAFNALILDWQSRYTFVPLLGDVPISSLTMLNNTCTGINCNWPVLFTWGKTGATYGQLWVPVTSHVTNVTTLFNLATTSSAVTAASTVTLTNGTVIAAYTTGTTIGIYVVPGTAIRLTTGVVTDTIVDVATYALFNNQFGVSWLDTTSLYTLEWGALNSGINGYTNNLLVVSSGSSQLTSLSGDPNGGYRLSLTHPAFLVWNNTSSKLNIYTVELPSQQFITFTTFSSFSVSSFSSTTTSLSFQVGATTTSIITSNVTVPQTSSVPFATNLMVVFMMFIFPAALLGVLFTKIGLNGLLGFILGMNGGSALATAVGAVPVWVEAIVIFMTIFVILLWPNATVSRPPGEGGPL